MFRISIICFNKTNFSQINRNINKNTKSKEIFFSVSLKPKKRGDQTQAASREKVRLDLKFAKLL